MTGAGEASAPWHVRSVDEVAAALGMSTASGLAPDDAASRLTRYGPNAIEEARPRGPVRVLLGQFSDFMVLVLVVAAILAGVIGEPQDAVAIGAILVLNAALGFVQEYRAERAIVALRALSVASVRVRRGKALIAVPGTSLVPGDLVLLEAGNLVPADLRLVEAAQLRIEEAALTGESHAVDKVPGALTDPDAPLPERRNMAYRGTLVAHGRGSGIVVAVGMGTELGRIARLIAQESAVKTPLQQRLAVLGQRLAIAALVICALILGLGLLRGEEPLRMVLIAISLAVAAIPEALPAVVTVALALGARRMVRTSALVRQLPAVETLGSVSFICADKTGTLTQNRMRVEAYSVDGDAAPAPPPGTHEPWSRLLEAMALNNDAAAGPAGEPVGDPTEAALFRAAADASHDPAEAARRCPRLGELPFTAERARMTTLHRSGTDVTVYTKGAPERVLESCVDRLTPNGPAPLDRQAVMKRNDGMAEEGLRVIGFSFRRLGELPAALTAGAVETGQTFLGLVGLMDPPRPEAAEAVRTCQSAGIRIVMITGDHPVTARSIARRLGILHAPEQVMTGREMARLSADALARRAESVRVYARVAPEQKIEIVRALQARRECVAMTGDGVNDAPALRRADIGVAMGRSGTDVAREAAHMVLLDDNFATIVTAVRAGRRIYDNIRKFVRYAVSCNAAEVWTLLLAPLVALPIPLVPIQLLWINLVTDGLPGIALAAEPAEPDVMRRPPRPRMESIFAHGLWQHLVWVGLLMAAVTLATQAWAYRGGSAHWQTMTFTVLALSQMGHVLAIRSERESLLRLGLWSNRLLLGAVALTVLLQLGIIYLPAAGAVFRTQPLTAGELGACLGLSTVVFIGVEIEKWLVRRGVLYRERRNVAAR
jgi:Ca2+-transporting ATPase